MYLCNHILYPNKIIYIVCCIFRSLTHLIIFSSFFCLLSVLVYDLCSLASDFVSTLFRLVSFYSLQFRLCLHEGCLWRFGTYQLLYSTSESYFFCQQPESYFVSFFVFRMKLSVKKEKTTINMSHIVI